MTEITIVQTSAFSDAAQPLLEALIREYDSRYGGDNNRPGGARSEIERYPAHAFAPPFGNFLLLQRDAETIAGGAFMSHDDETVEIKRIWTRHDLRRQGLARRVMAALEDNAAALGYTRAYLTTGFRQPDAVGLYLSLGYRPLFQTDADPALYRSLPFEKFIGRRAGHIGTDPVLAPAPSFDAATARIRAIKAEQAKKIETRLALFQAAE
jgi:GNAT superfamily N-acetyltransferase